ncbi:putative ABC transporter permease protein YphD [Cotonvirus japonicus]|uniref:ABC transporter permease protein YphD n=1 Tax=Cotonvirus japonicus TaxID=2811091 RepID=A0ABM7NSS4_9VIRU|nr:putative ABC transporter permease protein YphD [Cotonvirus japonicus]BCS83203.1 putative ABC transporter permease protein YphD [Cotonvirus japonicus]
MISLTGSLMISLIGSLTTSLTGSLMISLTGSLMTSLTGSLTTSLTGSLMTSLTGSLTTSLTGSLIGSSIIDSVINLSAKFIESSDIKLAFVVIIKLLLNGVYFLKMTFDLFLNALNTIFLKVNGIFNDLFINDIFVTL